MRSAPSKELAVLNDQLVQQAVRRRKVIRYAFVGVFAAIFVLIGAAIGLRDPHSLYGSDGDIE